MAREDAPEYFDVIVVGAGISGIGAGHYLRKNCPGKSFAILENRENIGGTWDLFRYPGIRSDSDMFTLGYVFKPWTEQKAIADGPSILNYLEETAREEGLTDKIRFRHKVVGASWSSEEARWTVEVERGEIGETAHYQCNFLFMCTGYYSYEGGYTPEWEGFQDYRGTIVHPQHWPRDLDYADKQVLVIGSGATAVTLVPAMIDGEGAPAHVTMLQRSPTYMISRPSEDKMANCLRKYLPRKLAYRLIRWRNTFMQRMIFRRARNKPDKVRDYLIGDVRQKLGPDYDVATHFTPSYKPWEQRLCLVPDADFFRVVRKGEASVVTGHIDRFTETGVKLRSGEQIEADIVITATGLNLQVAGGFDLRVDGKPVEVGEHVTYKSMMLDDVPNFAFSFGYLAASWTLRSDLTCEYVSRLIRHMEATNSDIAVPRLPGDGSVEKLPWADFSSGYIQRAAERIPFQGDKHVWRNLQDYQADRKILLNGAVTDEAMVFAKAGELSLGEVEETEPIAAE